MQAMPSSADRPSRTLFWEIKVFILVCLLSLGVLLDHSYGSGIVFGHFRKLRLLQMTPMGLLILMGVGLAVLVRQDRYYQRISSLSNRCIDLVRKLGVFNWVLFTAFPAIFPFILISPRWERVTHYLPGVWLFGAMMLVTAIALSGVKRNWRPAVILLVAATACAVSLVLFYNLKIVSSSVFSESWSESRQMYFSSTFFSRAIYGFWAPLPVLQPGYEILNTIPFLIHGLPIWVHRLWLGILWIGFGFGTALGLARNLRIQTPGYRILLIGWTFLYFMEVPVFLQLLACVFLVLLGFTKSSPRNRWVAIICASAWAGLCRVNWFPLPGALAAVLYLLETRWESRGWRYFLQPAGWMIVGTLVAFFTNTIYMLASRNPISYFSTTFTSPLLWYRLFPSATNPIGVFISTLIYSMPVIALVVYAILRRRCWHTIRLLGLIGLVGVFFSGGLVVSAKIGGGDNIHNMDAYFTLIWIIAAYTYFDRFSPDRPSLSAAMAFPAWMVVSAIAIPLLFVLPAASRQMPDHFPYEAQALAQIQSYVDQVNQSGGKGDILFIDQRQLLSLGLIKGVKLVPEYEKVFLMEMAMAQNANYFEKFDQDIQSHRFALIVCEPLQLGTRGKNRPFGEENDAWVKWVSVVVLANYKPVLSMPDIGFAIYAPINQ
jgi:hypothetical protein